MNIYANPNERISDKNKAGTFKLLAVSILLHSFIIVIFVLTAREQKAPIPISKTVTLKSYLYKPNVVKEKFEPPAQILIPEIVGSEDKKFAPEGKKPELREVTTTSATAQLDQKNKPIVLPEYEKIEAALKEAALKEALAQKPNQVSSPTILTNKNPLSPTLSTITQNPYQQLITKQLQSFQNQYSQSQAEEYRQLKTSPVINTQTAVNTFTPREVAPNIHVDCNSSLKKALANIAIVTNGRVRCRNNNQFQQFIDKRLPNTIDEDDKRSKSR